ncbi:MAG: acyltransferase [Desulfobacterales bacterium]|nr:acyltransferase [Desulfobacterales bacterium]
MEIIAALIPIQYYTGDGGLTIGNNVRIAAHTVIIPANHVFDDVNIPIRKQGLSKKGIVIEDDVWIGSGVKILDGVVIGKGCVIGAGRLW